MAFKVSQLVGLFIFFVAMAVVVWLVTARGFSTKGDLPLLQTPMWQSGSLQYGEQMLVRRESNSTEVLLLKNNKHEPVYRYDPGAGSLSISTEQFWQQASGEVAECGKQFALPRSTLRIDVESGKLMAGEREVKVAGRTALRLTASPSGKWVAVLSASGARKPGFLPFSGPSSGASGKYYHQLLSLPELSPSGKPIQIPIKQRYDSLFPCWSADEKFVVYYEVSFGYLVVLKVGDK